jgi:hypothetical protein
MEWIKGEPKKEGKYLTIREFNIFEKTYSDPKVCEFSFVRFRTTNEIVKIDGEIETCWVTKDNRGATVDYYMELPKNPIN